MNSKLTGLPLWEGCTQLLPSFALLQCAQTLAASPTSAVGATDASVHSRGADPIYQIIRGDDCGVSHSVHVALETLSATGFAVPVPAVNSVLNNGKVNTNPRLREIAEHLASEHRLGTTQYLGERPYNPRYTARPQDKTESLIDLNLPLLQASLSPPQRSSRRRGVGR